jgi:hypothetical protein
MQSGSVSVELYLYKDTHIYQAIGSVCINSASPVKVKATPPLVPMTKTRFSNPGGKYRRSKFLLPFGNLAGTAALCLLPHSRGVL